MKAKSPKRKSSTCRRPCEAEYLQDESYRLREHPDIRLARRARTIANLTRIISERKVRIGIRRTLMAQARRLEALAKTRLKDFEAEQNGEVDC